MVRINPFNAREVDGRLRQALHDLQLAERNAVLWFGEILTRKLFKELGFSSIYQYAGEVLGFSPSRTAQFIRLCESLEGLPALKQAVAKGKVSWTKARVVERVATPQTESAWVDLAQRESRRKLERRVRLAQTRGRAKRRSNGRQLGLATTGTIEKSRPSPPSMPPPDPPSARSGGDADATSADVTTAGIPVTLSLRFTPEQYARYEAMIERLRKRGERGNREEVFLAGLEALLVEAVRDTGNQARSSSVGAAAAKATTATPRGARDVHPRSINPAYQIVVQQCEDCGRARVQTSRGPKPIDPETVETMKCDAHILRPGERNRATIPPALRREVLARDGYCCRAPGCDSARFLEVHHVVPRAKGGANRPDNLVTLCSACHQLAHSHLQFGRALAGEPRECSGDSAEGTAVGRTGRRRNPGAG